MKYKKEANQPRIYQKLTFGQKASDRLTSVVGSWVFIFALVAWIIFWVIINVYFLFVRWDPFPFILLNLTLSTIAAIQAPIILMSQNRMAQRDRVYMKYDYEVNRKAEREIQNMQRDLEEIKKMLRKLK
ncbi:DUF1003 domain-containing protein [Candidatus Woesearchaeota archaeon]|nr:DUF1003 domain-containing protein [Candidatus Woesearchaeota archaeon]